MKAHQSDKYRHLGLNIAYYRRERGFSQSQLAELINSSFNHISRIERAESAASLDLIFDLCDALEITPRQLFDFRD